MLEIDCRKCNKCTGTSCLCYGDDADKAVKACADDGFKNYTIKTAHNDDLVLNYSGIFPNGFGNMF